MVTRKYLDQLYDLLGKRLDADVKEYQRTLPADIRVDALGIVSRAVRNIEFEMKQIEDAISLAEDMEKGLKEAPVG